MMIMDWIIWNLNTIRKSMLVIRQNWTEAFWSFQKANFFWSIPPVIWQNWTGSTSVLPKCNRIYHYIWWKCILNRYSIHFNCGCVCWLFNTTDWWIGSWIDCWIGWLTSTFIDQFRPRHPGRRKMDAVLEEISNMVTVLLRHNSNHFSAIQPISTSQQWT